MAKPMITIILRNDDPCALSDSLKERRVLELFEKYGFAQVFSVIPNVTIDPHNAEGRQFHRLDENKEMVALLQEYQQKGLIEFAQHGFTHQTNLVHPSKKTEILDDDYYQGFNGRWLPFSPTNPKWYSEFNGIKDEEKNKRISLGKKILEDVLKVDIKTFVFPWDSLDQASLDVLVENDFETVLCNNSNLKAHQLNLFACCHNDILTLPEFIKEMTACKHSVLTHVEYHAWMLSDSQIQELDNVLNEMACNKNVQIIVLSQLHRICPEFKKIQGLKRCLDHLIEKGNVVLGKKKVKKKYFVLSPQYYRFEIIKTWIFNFLVRMVASTKH